MCFKKKKEQIQKVIPLPQWQAGRWWDSWASMLGSWVSMRMGSWASMLGSWVSMRIGSWVSMLGSWS
jgi:hypothetical protein